MMNLTEIVIVGLAIWRISSLFVREDGPFFVFERIRRLSGIRPERLGAVTPYGFFAQALSCIWCLSIWVGTLWGLFFFFFPSLSFWVAFPFALSAVAIIIDLLVLKLKL